MEQPATPYPSGPPKPKDLPPAEPPADPTPTQTVRKKPCGCP